MRTSSPTSPSTTPLKILTLGPPGSRKTSFFLQCPNLLVLDCDRNLVGPETYLRTHGHPALTFGVEDIRYDSKGNPREIWECYDTLMDTLRRLKPDVDTKGDYKQFKNIFVDSLSHVNELIIRKILKVKAKESMDPNHWTDFKSLAYSFLVSKLEETNRNIICSAHEVTLTKPSDKVMVQEVIGVEPFFQGKVGDMIGAFFTDVWRMDLRLASGGRRELWLQTERTGLCAHLKNSIGLPAEINVTEGFKVIEPYLKNHNI
jgi:hypothetical protein